MLVEMAADGGDDRRAVGALSYPVLLDRSRRAAAWLATRSGRAVGLVDVNSEAAPIALFGAAMAGLPFAPLNYRWSDDQLRRSVERLAPAVLIVGDDVVDRVTGIDGIDVVTRAEFLDALDGVTPIEGSGEETDSPAVLLFTSGTAGDPKVAVLRHDNLVSYIFGSVEFMGANPDEAALASVPPYHIAGIAGVLSAVYHGRRIVQLAA